MQWPAGVTPPALVSAVQAGEPAGTGDRPRARECAGAGGFPACRRRAVRRPCVGLGPLLHGLEVFLERLGQRDDVLELPRDQFAGKRVLAQPLAQPVTFSLLEKASTKASFTADSISAGT